MALSNGPNLGLLVNAAQGEAHFAEQQRLLRGLDALVQPSVKDKDLATPPGSPADGDRYIVAAAPTGAWVGHAGEIARWSSVATAWEFYVPKAGWRMYVEDEAAPYTYTGVVWIPLLLAVDTADQGYFIPPTIFPPLTGTSTIVGAINQVRVAQFVLPFRAVAGRATYEITIAGAAGKKLGVAFYNADRTLNFESGAQAADSTGVKSVTFTAVTLEPRVYFFAVTADDATLAARITSVSTTIPGLLNAKALKKWGTAANAASAGVMPATLGTITPAVVNMLATVFEP